MVSRQMAGENLVETVVGESHEWHGIIFDVERLTVRCPDDTLAARDIVRHSGGVAVIALDGEGRLCIVRQWRVALGRMTQEIPAGKLEPGEDPRDAARRELLEETGLVAKNLQHVYSLAGSPGFTDERTQIFLASGLTKTEAQPDEGEFLNMEWVHVSELARQAQEGGIEDGNTIVAILVASQILGIDAVRVDEAG